MADLTKLQRQWLLLRTLSVRALGAALKDLAAETSSAERTIRRDWPAPVVRTAATPQPESVRN